MNRQSSWIAIGLALLTSVVIVACSSDDDSGSASGGSGGSAGNAGSAGHAGSLGAEGGAGGAQELAGAADTGGEAGEGIEIGISGPSDASATTNTLTHPTGTAADGQAVFRFETFGNEGFGTSVLQLPQGMAAAGVTPVMALQAGLSVDIDAIPAGAVKDKLAAEVKTDLSPANAPTLSDPATTMALIEMNAILGPRSALWTCCWIQHSVQRTHLIPSTSRTPRIARTWSSS
jgi:hypothetical protein